RQVQLANAGAVGIHARAFPQGQLPEKQGDASHLTLTCRPCLRVHRAMWRMRQCTIARPPPTRSWLDRHLRAVPAIAMILRESPQPCRGSKRPATTRPSKPPPSEARPHLAEPHLAEPHLATHLTAGGVAGTFQPGSQWIERQPLDPASRLGYLPV